MSSFNYGKHTKKHIGLWLRYRSNSDVIKLIKESKHKRFFDTVERVVVSEYDKETNQVWLEVWCKNLIDSIRGKLRYNVFHIKTNINKDWICEGDLGNGCNF
jgi:hypothetical protein